MTTQPYTAGSFVCDTRTTPDTDPYHFGRILAPASVYEPMQVELYPGAADVDAWPYVWTVEDDAHAAPFAPNPDQLAEYNTRIAPPVTA